MSNAGFTTWTDTGILQIDANFKNFQLVKKTQVKCTEGDADIGPFYEGEAYLSGTQPIFVAIRNVGDDITCYLRTLYNDGGKWIIRVGARTPNQFVEVYIFSVGQISLPSSCGLVVYDEHGEPVFSSAVPYLNIHSIYNINGITTINNLPVSKYALAPPFFATGTYRQPPNWRIITCSVFNVTSTGFTVGELLWKRLGGTVDFEVYNIDIRGQAIMIDISNTDDINWS